MLTNEELRELNKLIFGYIPEKIGSKELRKIERRIRLRSYDKIFAYEGISRLYDGLNVESEKGCWVKEDWSDYRKIRIGNKVISAHRASYILLRGPIPYSQPFVCHFCDRKGCVNPFHLFTGTLQENLKDYHLKFNPSPPQEVIVTRNEQGRVTGVKIIKL